MMDHSVQQGQSGSQNVLILRDLWGYQLDDRVPRTEILMDG